MRSLYFGCIQRPGHYMFEKGNSWKHIWPIDFQPWGLKLDGGLTPDKRAGGIQGVAAIHHKEGWTAISFADRSVDTRMGCSSTFLFDADFTFDEAVAQARADWPEIWDRYTFDVVLKEN